MSIAGKCRGPLSCSDSRHFIETITTSKPSAGIEVCDYRLDVAVQDVWLLCSYNHRQNVNKSERGCRPE